MGIVHPFTHTLTIQVGPRVPTGSYPNDPIAELYPDLQERISKALTFTTTVKNTYTNVCNIMVNKNKCAFRAVTYMAETDRRVIHQENLEIEIDLESGQSLYTQIYAGLKALPAYAKATDA